MLLPKQDHRTEAVIALDTTATANITAVGAKVTPANLPAGAACVVNLAGERLDDSTPNFTLGTDFTKFRIAVGRGSDKELFLSNVLDTSTDTLTSKKYVAPTQQLSYVGYNGTSGSLPAANDTSYFIKLRKRDNDERNRTQPDDIFFQFKTDSSGTQEELAFGLLGNAVKNLASYAALANNGYVKVELVNNAAATNTEWGGLGNPTGNATFTNGSKQVTMTDTQDLAAGDFFRVSTSITETLVDPVYKIASVDSITQITLTDPFQGDTGAVDDDFIHQIGSLAGADWGVKITGRESDFNTLDFRNYFQHRFDLYFSEESTLVTTSTKATEGNGTYQEASWAEYFNYANNGQRDQIAVPARQPFSSVVSGDAFSIITINYDNPMPSKLVSAGNAKGRVDIYLELTDNAGSFELGGAGDLNSPFALGSTLFNVLTGVTLTTQLDA